VRQVLSDPNTRALYDRERLRFHALASRPRPPLARPPARPAEVAVSAGSRREPTVARHLRAALLGLRVAVSGLLPARCRGCRTVISGEDAYCAACGTPLLTGG
jgi:hypothetical protein